jgi:hypothetical protein
MMTSTFRRAAAAALCGLILGMTGAPPAALGAGGGGGGGLSSVTISLVQPNAGTGKAAPRGLATLTFDPTEANRAVNVQITNAHLPNGTVLNVVFTDNGLIAPSSGWVPQLAGLMVVHNGTASGSISTANGDQVPVFGGNGEITVNFVDLLANPGPLYMFGVYTIGNGQP